MSRFILCFILLGACTSTANATIQVKSLLILEGEHIYTYRLPLLKDAFPDIKFPEFKWITTANRKGYTATWATFQNQLYLVGLQGQTSLHGKLLKNEDITTGHTFPLKVTSWSGKIVQTELLDPDSYSLREVKVKTITVKKGKVIHVKLHEKRNPRPNSGD